MPDDPGARAVLDDRYTPNDMERHAQALLDRLFPQRDAAMNERERNELSARIKTARMLRD